MRQLFDIASGKNRLRTLLASRIVAWLIIGAVALTMLLKVALPLFISTASVKTNMEQVLSSWTGARARIGADPVISFWPHPVLTLRAVTFEGGDAGAPRLLAKADAIAAGFDILAALRSNPVFYDFRLINPVLHIERRTDGGFNWRRAGWMADAVADAKKKMPPESVRDTPIGDIEIENGTLELVDNKTASAHRIGAISGTVDWPTPAAPVNASLSAVMNGQTVELSVAINEPVALLAGQNTAIETSFTSLPLTFSFEGVASGSTHPFASGQLRMKADSIAALTTWHKSGGTTPIDTASATGAVSIDTSITISGEMMKMDNLFLSLNRASATGVLDVAFHHQPNPRIDGTLAFDQLDLQSLFETFSPLLPKSETRSGSFDLAFLKWISLDLRLSAEQASYGPVVLTDVAAGIMADNLRASIDIGDATYSGGSFNGRLAVVGDGNDGGQLQLSLKNADLTPAIALLDLQGPLPLGRGVINADLSTTRPLWAMTAEDISGGIQYTATEGVLTHFNATEFERLVGQGGPFNIADAGDGSLAFASTQIVATLKGGIAELTTADIRGEGRAVSLTGIIPYNNGSLALAGTIRPDDSALPASRFSVGGSWPNPVVSPLSVIPATR